MSKIDIKIRYNTAFPTKSDKKWRVIVGGVQNLVDDIEIHSKCFSTQDIVLDDEGNDVEKFHISTLAKTFSIKNTKGTLKAIIK